MKHLTPEAYDLIKASREMSSMVRFIAPKVVAEQGHGEPGITTKPGIRQPSRGGVPAFGRVETDTTHHHVVYRDTSGKPVAMGVGVKNKQGAGITSMYHDHTREGLLPHIAAGRVLHTLNKLGYNQPHPTTDMSFASERLDAHRRTRQGLPQTEYEQTP